MSSDLVKEGFSQGGLLPSMAIVDLPATSTGFHADATTTWKDVVAETALAYDMSSPASSGLVLNTSPAKFALSGTGLSVLVPGLYEGELWLHLYESSTSGSVRYGFAVVENADSPTTYYEEDNAVSGGRDLAASEKVTLHRKFLVDISEPKVIQLVVADRGGAGNLEAYGGQFSLKRISKYTAVTRT